MNKQEMFDQAKKDREAERQKEADRKSGVYTGTYEEINYVALDTDAPDCIVRIIGTPKGRRENNFDPKEIYYSSIVGDNGKQFKCVWPSKEKSPDWILWKIFDLVMAGKTDSITKIKAYTYANSHPDIFNRVAKNNKAVNHKGYTFEKGWKPKTYVVMNVIDRQTPEWNKENKHTKLLSAKASGNDEVTFYDPGIPVTCYNKIWDDVVEYFSVWEDYDIAVRKLTSEPWYAAFDTKSSIFKIKEESKKFIVDGPLTEEELAYEKYDIDKLFKITSYQKIKKNLGVFIQLVDSAFNKNFTSELDILVEKEKAEIEKNKVKEEEKEAPKNEKAPTTTPTATEAAPARRSKPTHTTFDISQLDRTVFVGLDLLTDVQKKTIIGVKAGGDDLVYSKDAGQPCKCLSEGCNCSSPQTFDNCPKCGISFTEK